MENAVDSDGSERAAGLARRIAAGDRQAEAELVEISSRGLSYMLRRLTGDRARADDLHQETFRVVLEKLRRGELREPEKLIAFVRGTARNLALAGYRKAARRPESTDLDAVADPPDPAPSALGRVLQGEDRRHVRRILSELRSDRDRQLLFRFYIAEESKEKVCGALGLSSRQFNVAIFRARQRFKQLAETSPRRPGSSEVRVGI